MKWANHYSMKFIDEGEKNHIELIKRNLWIPPFATVKRLMQELKEKPFRWHRNKEIRRSVRIMTKDEEWHLWFRLHYSPTVKWFYLEIHFILNGLERTAPQILYGDDFRGAYDIIKEQITGGWE